jgi:PAS domain-containing protein
MRRKAFFTEPQPHAFPDSGEGRDHPGGGPPEKSEAPSALGPDASQAGAGAVSPVSADLRHVLADSEPAVLLMGEAGFVVFANKAANSLLEYETDEILDVHFTQICIHDPSWLEQQLQRLKQNGVWSGRVTLRGRHGRLVNAGVNAAVLVRPSESLPTYVVFIHPVNFPVEATAFDLDSLPHDLTPADVVALQLIVEGFSMPEIATILAQTEPALGRTTESLLQKLGVTSLAEACLVAMKERLID